MYNYNYNFNSNIIKPNIIFHARGDVNGDFIPDNVYLMGIKTPDSPFIQNITLVIQDGSTSMLTTIPLEENAGYNPTLFLGDFTGNRVNDILISIDSGGSGAFGYYYIYSFIQNNSQLLFDFNKYNEQYKYDVIYRDNYQVEIISRENNKKYIIDIAYKGADYLNEIYDSNGKLKSSIEGFVGPVGGLYPIDFNLNQVYELMAFQEISGRYHADSLGYVQNILSLEKEEFVLYNQYIAILG